MQKVWLVSKVLNLSNGSQVAIPVRILAEKRAAQEFVSMLENEAAMLVAAQLLVHGPQGARAVGHGGSLVGLMGISSFQVVATEVEVHSGQLVVPAGPKLVVPS